MFLVKKPKLEGKLARWMILLQDFDFIVIYTLGNKHVAADFLSRLENLDEPPRVSNNFPDTKLFHVVERSFDNWYN